MYKMIMSGAVDHGAAHLSVASSLIWSEKQSAALHLWSNTHWQTNKPKHIKPQHNRSLQSSCPTSECPEWWEKSVSFLVLWASNTKCSWTQSPTRSGKWLQSAVHVIQASSTRCLRTPSPQSTSGFKKKKKKLFLFFLASSLGIWGGVQPREAGSGESVSVGLKEQEVSAFLDGCPIGVRRELGQAWLLHSGIMRENRVLSRRAGGAPGVRVAGRILVQRYWKLQILLQ